MLAFNPREPQFQNGTRPSWPASQEGEGRKVSVGKVFLQISEHDSASAEYNVGGGVGEDTWAALSEQS